MDQKYQQAEELRKNSSKKKKKKKRKLSLDKFCICFGTKLSLVDSVGEIEVAGKSSVEESSWCCELFEMAGKLLCIVVVSTVLTPKLYGIQVSECCSSYSVLKPTSTKMFHYDSSILEEYLMYIEVLDMALAVLFRWMIAGIPLFVAVVSMVFTPKLYGIQVSESCSSYSVLKPTSTKMFHYDSSILEEYLMYIEVLDMALAVLFRWMIACWGAAVEILGPLCVAATSKLFVLKLYLFQVSESCSSYSVLKPTSMMFHYDSSILEGSLLFIILGQVSMIVLTAHIHTMLFIEGCFLFLYL